MYITAVGMMCPVGLSAPPACAAMRAGVAMFVELPYRDNSGEPVIGAPVPGLDPTLKRDDRLVELAAGAVSDCMSNANDVVWQTVPLLLGLAEPGRPGGGAHLVDTIVERLEKKLGVRFHPGPSRAISSGHTAGFEGLRLARELFQDPAVSCCLIVGVDSYLNASALNWLDRHDRLKTLDNSDGVIPGEAGAAVLVSRDPPKSGPVVRVAGIGFGQEQAHVLCDEPLLGLGLAEAARGALAEAGCSFHEMGWRISDVTGEQYAFKELALVEGRLARVVRKEPQPLWHAADSTGDIGAAAGIAELIVADTAYRKQYAPGRRAIAFSASVPGSRAVAVLEPNGGGRKH